MTLSSDPRLLSELEVVAQGILIHPDWDAKMHAWYLNEEAFHLRDDYTEAEAQDLMEEAVERLRKGR